MSARDELRLMLFGWSCEDGQIDRRLDAFRTEVLAEAIEAVRSEYLHEDTGTPEDAAYNQGVTDAIAAIGALTEATAPAAPAPAAPTADVPEFAVRWPDGGLTRAADRTSGLRAIESAHRAEPGAVLMQRSCTPWTEVTS